VLSGRLKGFRKHNSHVNATQECRDR
jgi:hypothetical protein